MSVLADDGALPLRAQPVGPVATLPAATAVAMPGSEVLRRLGTGAGGLTSKEAAARLAAGGPNAVRSHHARALHLLARQLRSAILLLLVVTAAASYLLGNKTDSVIIGVILLASVGLGFGNEYRAERAAASLHDVVRRTAVVLRDGQPGAGRRDADRGGGRRPPLGGRARAGRPAPALGDRADVRRGGPDR